MIKCEVIENFTLEKFNQLENVKKVEIRKGNEFGVGDTFDCTEKMADYLTGNNALNKTVVKVIEVEPEQVEKAKVEENASKEKIRSTDESTIEKKPRKKKTSKK